MSRGFSGGKQMIKAANARNHGRVCLCYQNMTTIQFSSEKAISSFDKIYDIIVCCEDIYGRYSIQRSNNDYFYP